MWCPGVPVPVGCLPGSGELCLLTFSSWPDTTILKPHCPWRAHPCLRRPSLLLTAQSPPSGCCPLPLPFTFSLSLVHKQVFQWLIQFPHCLRCWLFQFGIFCRLLIPCWLSNYSSIRQSWVSEFLHQEVLSFKDSAFPGSGSPSCSPGSWQTSEAVRVLSLAGPRGTQSPPRHLGPRF